MQTTAPRSIRTNCCHLIHHDAYVYISINSDHGAAFLLLSQAIPHHFLADQPHRCEEKYVVCADIAHVDTITNCDTDISLFYSLLYSAKAKQDNSAVEQEPNGQYSELVLLSMYRKLRAVGRS